MNHSIHSADRSTHLKIVVVALVAGIAVAAFVGQRRKPATPVSRNRLKQAALLRNGIAIRALPLRPVEAARSLSERSGRQHRGAEEQGEEFHEWKVINAQAVRIQLRAES